MSVGARSKHAGYGELGSRELRLKEIQNRNGAAFALVDGLRMAGFPQSAFELSSQALRNQSASDGAFQPGSASPPAIETTALNGGSVSSFF